MLKKKRFFKLRCVECDEMCVKMCDVMCVKMRIGFCIDCDVSG